MTMLETIDISDICSDIDSVALFVDSDGKYRAKPFVIGDGGDLWQSSADLTEYPAICAVCQRRFDSDRIQFEPNSTVSLRDRRDDGDRL